ncbi:hypothetical protein [Clostridium beijerinckii]|uniref:hypothetical protein n=1 Tax=Clostridium beijerinckii TaxID=1520 RepID=UPI00136148BA|nr:hypothetical protein [Clostridium beijerinckii]MZK52093.1 hypothetical protein [Clostridium beijerinckii]MZK60234.1 hypothetical protein [Clostridium beijerinckii]MZK70519.1 hypothetical protein [Clostridium beijerinckii]MZK75822.1 hypothetical protein [Clostridium beijerinckii]MZK85485.1 hypothetical protein [Clostridium beijerinckii]
MECIATISYLIEVNNLESESDIISAFKSWSEDKARRFSEEDILNGIEYLNSTRIITKTLVGYRVQ